MLNIKSLLEIAERRERREEKILNTFEDLDLEEEEEEKEILGSIFRSIRNEQNSVSAWL